MIKIHPGLLVNPATIARIEIADMPVMPGYGTVRIVMTDGTCMWANPVAEPMDKCYAEVARIEALIADEESTAWASPEITTSPAGASTDAPPYLAQEVWDNLEQKVRGVERDASVTGQFRSALHEILRLTDPIRDQLDDAWLDAEVADHDAQRHQRTLIYLRSVRNIAIRALRAKQDGTSTTTAVDARSMQDPYKEAERRRV